MRRRARGFDTSIADMGHTTSFAIDLDELNRLAEEEIPFEDASNPGLACLLDSPLRCVALSGLQRVAGKLTAVSLKQGEHLLRQGEVAAALYFLTSGHVKIQLHNGTETIMLDIGESGEVLGEMSFLTGATCTADVVAMDTVSALGLSRPDYEELREEYPELEIALGQLVSERLGKDDQDALTGKQIGEYHLNRCINRGGMGVVYEAQHNSGRKLALKMLRHKFIREPQVIYRFLQEGKLLAELNHPNIVSVTECFVAFNTRFLAMDYWDGPDLASQLGHRAQNNEMGLPSRECERVFEQVATALDFAHQHGILHLDIKPGNILSSSNGVYALSDFGLSQLIGRSDPEDSVVGTFPYMPLEQFHSRELSKTADYYSFACTMVELITGRRLFAQSSRQEIREAKEKSPEELLPNLDCTPRIREFIQLGLEPKAEDRKIDLAKYLEA